MSAASVDTGSSTRSVALIPKALLAPGTNISGLELNGARSNPRAGVELSRLGALHDELLRKAQANPREPRSVPAKVSPVLETVTRVLERAGKPMPAREIHAAACELVGEPLLWRSVKAALSADVTGKHPRFRRVRRGVYQLTRDVRRCTSRAALPTRSSG